MVKFVSRHPGIPAREIVGSIIYIAASFVMFFWLATTWVNDPLISLALGAFMTIVNFFFGRVIEQIDQ